MSTEIIFNIFLSLLGLIVMLAGSFTYLSGEDTSGWAWRCAIWATIAVAYVWKQMEERRERVQLEVTAMKSEIRKKIKWLMQKKNI